MARLRLWVRIGNRLFRCLPYPMRRWIVWHMIMFGLGFFAEFRAGRLALANATPTTPVKATE